MSEFLYVTIAAMGILVAGGILGGFGMTGPAGGGVAASEPLFFENLGRIGAASDVEPTSRTVNLGSFTVEETSPNKTVTEENSVTVKNSGIGGESSTTLEFEASNPRTAYLSFIPTSAANADNLIVLVNGERVPVDNLAMDRRNTLRIDKKHLRRGSNVVRLEVADPGLAVWRSPSFTLEKLRIVLDDLQHDGVVKPFSTTDSIIQGFHRGKIKFFVTQNVLQDRPLRIRLNGNTIATRTPFKQSAPYTVSFFANTTGLRVGENVLTFSTGGNSQYPLQNAELQLYYWDTEKERTTIREFTVSPGTYKALGKDKWAGQIRFYVGDQRLPRPLSIRLPNRSYMFRPEPEWNTLQFDQPDIKKGTNKIQLATAGSYKIENFNVSLVKTG